MIIFAFLLGGLAKGIGKAALRGLGGLVKGALGGGGRGGGSVRIQIEESPRGWSKNLAKNLHAERIEKIMAKRVRHIAELVDESLERETPVRSGRLVKSQGFIRKSDLEYHIVQGQGVPYTRAVIEGVPRQVINPIVPRRKQALWWPGLPHPVKIVRNHPGIPPNPYPTRALKRVESRLDSEVNSLADDIFNEVTRGL